MAAGVCSHPLHLLPKPNFLGLFVPQSDENSWSDGERAPAFVRAKYRRALIADRRYEAQKAKSEPRVLYLLLRKSKISK